jgi:hypothetical protein
MNKYKKILKIKNKNYKKMNDIINYLLLLKNLNFYNL